MQKIIKGFLVSFGCGKGTVSQPAPPAAPPSAPPVAAPASVSITSNSGKRPQKTKKPSDDGIIDMDKCFEVGYNCVERATTELIEALHKNKIQGHSFDMYTRWNTELRICW